MKVGGNESATKFFQQNGGTAALNSKDPKTKYQSNARHQVQGGAEEEGRERRERVRFGLAAASSPPPPPGPRLADLCPRYPNEVVITDGNDAADSSSTPAGEQDDDFFSSWDKPAVKKPTPPISRTATPPVVGRTPSPFLNVGANGKDIARASSPLARSDSADPQPAPSRITHSAALKKTAGPKKANVLRREEDTEARGQEGHSRRDRL